MLILLVFYVLLFPARVLATCYNPDGSVQDGESYKPCIAIDGSKTMCCALNRTNPSGGLLSDGWTADICLGNGLCQNIVNGTGDDGESWSLGSTYWRDQCWTSDWNSSGNCLNYCMGEETSHMTPCDGTKNSSTWCCGDDNTACCGTSSAITISQYFGDYDPSSTRQESTSRSSSGMSTGTKAAIGLGVALGVTLVASACAIFLLWRQRNQLRMQSMNPQPGYHRNVAKPQELMESSGVSGVFSQEMPNRDVLELPATGAK
ncbi:uncharacterized protein N7483_001780 [Penicillium malachiteum]|uniref:uncharacterized protein n=1 Tax=Penicillium malachiteum TaxID=1324776 RepID=UPI00254983B6|nr:uncharacterized protein N7483_001780 [Penicillium malachiteum]KAJ5736655.1 hypothetical protein N7483_001780 [Penicillium malachiteum]